MANVKFAKRKSDCSMEPKAGSLITVTKLELLEEYSAIDAIR